MLAPRPASTDANAPYNLAAAAAEMVWACAMATTRVTVASTARSLELWSHLLRTPAGASDLASDALPVAEPDAHLEPTNVLETATAQDGKAAASGEASSFASYRSAGGHATAQVTIAS